MRHPADGTIICDVCLRKAGNYPCEPGAGHWFKRGERDICPRCAYIVNRALALGIARGEMFGIDTIVLEIG